MQIYANNYLNWKRKEGVLENGNVCQIAIMSGGILGTRSPNEKWRTLSFERTQIVLVGEYWKAQG